MSPEERSLPLFPLNTVLFPNASVPLQIFEERYKRMLRDCLDSDSRFGVVLIKAGSEVGEPAIPYSIGTIAHIVQVNEIRGGRYFVSAVGERRFRIKNITQYRPYMAAQVEMLEEEDSTLPDTRLEEIRQAVSQYASLVMGLQGGWTRQTRITSDPVALSYYIAGMLQVEMPEKQAILEELSTARRLDTELGHLKRDTEMLKQQVSRELRRKFSRQ